MGECSETTKPHWELAADLRKIAARSNLPACYATTMLRAAAALEGLAPLPPDPTLDGPRPIPGTASDVR